MTWTRTPQEYPTRADVSAVSRSARWLLIEMYSWSNAHLTDGRVPRAVLRRISDAEDPETDAAELLREGLLEEPEDGFLFLDWTDQEDAETVKARAKRNADKAKRARQRKEMHMAGDHSLCVAPYCKLGVTPNVTGTVTGNAGGNGTGNGTGGVTRTSPKRASVTRTVTGSVTPLQSSPIQSSPVQSVRSKGLVMDKDGLDGPDSAGAPSSPGLNEHGLEPVRVMPNGFVVTASMVGGVDPNTLTQYQLEDAMCESALADDRG